MRWYGHRKIERFLKRLYLAAKAEDPTALVTYVNYPSTEYLDLPFLDFVSFNVYLESRDKLEAYVARLQRIDRNVRLASRIVDQLLTDAIIVNRVERSVHERVPLASRNGYRVLVGCWNYCQRHVNQTIRCEQLDRGAIHERTQT